MACDCVNAILQDVSTTTWQFSQQSFSPRSIVSVNGAREDIMKVQYFILHDFPH